MQKLNYVSQFQAKIKKKIMDLDFSKTKKEVKNRWSVKHYFSLFLKYITGRNTVMLEVFLTLFITVSHFFVKMCLFFFFLKIFCFPTIRFKYFLTKGLKSYMKKHWINFIYSLGNIIFIYSLGNTIFIYSLGNIIYIYI